MKRNLFLVGLLAALAASQAMADGMQDAQKCVVAAGDWDLIIHYCTRAVNSGELSDYNLSVVINGRGVAWSAIRDYERAMADFNAAIRLNPQLAQPFRNRGLIRLRKGDYDRALADYDEAIRLDPRFADAYNERGVAWYEKKEYDRAIADFESALRLNPNDARALYNRGNAWRGKGDNVRALDDYQAATRIDPDVVQKFGLKP